MDELAELLCNYIAEIVCPPPDGRSRGGRTPGGDQGQVRAQRAPRPNRARDHSGRAQHARRRRASRRGAGPMDMPTCSVARAGYSSEWRCAKAQRRASRSAARMQRRAARRQAAGPAPVEQEKPYAVVTPARGFCAARSCPLAHAQTVWHAYRSPRPAQPGQHCRSWPRQGQDAGTIAVDHGLAAHSLLSDMVGLGRWFREGDGGPEHSRPLRKRCGGSTNGSSVITPTQVGLAVHARSVEWTHAV
jgi:hypothetical protein